MNEKRAKIIRKICRENGLPKKMYRKLKKTITNYHLDLTQSLHLLDAATVMYYRNMEKATEQLEKELNNGSDNGSESAREDNADNNQ